MLTQTHKFNEAVLFVTLNVEQLSFNQSKLRVVSRELLIYATNPKAIEIG